MKGPLQAQSFGVEEYTDFTSVEEQDFLNECPDMTLNNLNKQATAILKLCGIRTTPLLPSLLRPLWPGVVAPDRVLSVG